jgi:DNA replication and repair protein RecF
VHLVRLEATDFRNLHGSIEFSSGLNLLYGANAQGKTNWLEAAFLLATTKSFRTSQVREAISYGSGETLLRGTVAHGNLTKDLQLLITDTVKQTFVNGKREAVVRYLGNLGAIAFTVDDLEVVRGGPEARRRFIDRGLVGTLPAYLGTLAEYNRVVRQKNRLLHDAAEAEDPLSFTPLVEAWNEQLAALGTEIHNARVSYVERLSAALDPRLFKAESISVRYRSSLESKGDLNNYGVLLRERLVFHLRNEIAKGHSLVGPHRDDLDIHFDEREVSKFASRGQQRSALLVLDIAQINVYHSVLGEYPVFLIDDIDAELDRSRIEILLDYLEGKTQTIVSTSKRSVAERYRGIAHMRLISAGAAWVNDIPSSSTKAP